MFFSFFPDLIASSEPAPSILYDNDGEFIGKPPYSPKQFFPFGTNLIGESLLYNVLVGAKYTIIFVSIVCLLRFVISLSFAIIYAFYVHKFQHILKRIIEITYIMPPVIIVFFLLGPMTGVFHDESLGFMFLLMLVLVVIGVPPLTLLIGDEIKSELQQDYIKISRLQGVSYFYLFRKHLWRMVRPKLGMFFIQNNIQMLLLLIHLGVLSIFIGGDRHVQVSEEKSVLMSITNEWGGLIGSSYREFLHHPWVVLVPLFSFMILIMLLKMILAGMEESTKLN